MDAAIRHCTGGIGIWKWARNDEGAEPDLRTNHNRKLALRFTAAEAREDWPTPCLSSMNGIGGKATTI